MTTLQKFAFDYMPSLIGGLAGTAVGAGVGYAGSSQQAGEGEEEFNSRRRQNAGTGAIAGLGVGAGAPAVYSHLSDTFGDHAGPLSKVMDFFRPSNNPTIGGAVVGGAGGGAIGAAAMATKERFAKGQGAFANWVKQVKANAPGPAGVARAANATTALNNDANRNILSRLVGTPEEKYLMQAGAPKATFAGRRGGRWGALLGALGYAAYNNFANE